MVVRVFVSSISSSMEIKKNQQKICMILESMHIPFEQIDIASDEDQKTFMREKSDQPTCLPPQIFNDDSYCGDFEAFELAVDDEKLEEFLKISQD